MEFPLGPMEQLKAFGLPVYAARAYLALLELGVAEARGVSQLASIPTAKVYATLAQLQRRGLAQVTPGKPRKYTAVPMEEFIERHLREQEEQAAGLRDRAEEIVALFPLVGTAVLADRAQTIMLSGKRNILQRFREACMAAEEGVFVMATPDLARAESPIRRLLDQTIARGIDVHVLADPIEGDPFSRTDPAEGIAIATFDEQRAILLRLGSARSPDRRGLETAIHTSEPAFVRSLRRLMAMRQDDPGPVARAASQVEPRVFAERVADRIAQRPRHACAVIPVGTSEDLARDRLWRAASAAASARVILAGPGAHRVDAPLRARLPAHTEVKHVARPAGVSFAVLDGVHAFVISPSRATQGDAVYAVTADAAIVRAFEAQFEASWATASPLPPPLPSR